MKPVTLYTTQYCRHCARAKDLLKRKGISFREMDVTENRKEREDAEARYGWLTVPIIVIGDACIGGAQELFEMERNGELDSLLKAH